GTLQVESDLGQGSKFFFVAEFEKFRSPVRAGQTDAVFDVRGKRALVVDDNAASRRIIEKTLLQLGAQVVAVDSGASALQQLRMAVERHIPFDIALVDALMPTTDGFVVVSQINADSLMVGTLVLMISSADRSTFADKTRHIHVDGLLTKPVTRRRLLEAIR